MTFQAQAYPALVATHYGLGKAVYAPGSLFSEIDNLIEPRNVRQKVFLNSVKWVTNNKAPAQTTVLVTYAHRELVTYGHGVCCSTNIIEALRDKGYTVVITTDIPIALSDYDAVIMSGVGWFLSPNYPNPIYWSGDSGHAPTPAEVTSLLDFVQNGGGLVASVEYNYGADWMRPIGTAMSVTFESVSGAEGLAGTRMIHLLNEERAMLCELLAEWPIATPPPDSEPLDTEPGTPRTKSSQRMAAVREAEVRGLDPTDPVNKEPPDPSREPPRDD